MQAQQSLSNISGNRDLWIAEYRKELAERDYRSGLEAAENKGLKRGLAQGLSQGRNLQKFETAKSALNLGFTPEQISLITGLSESEIQRL